MTAGSAGLGGPGPRSAGAWRSAAFAASLRRSGLSAASMVPPRLLAGPRDCSIGFHASMNWFDGEGGGRRSPVTRESDRVGAARPGRWASRRGSRQGLSGGADAEASRLSLAAAGHRPAVHHPPRRRRRGATPLKARERYADRRAIDRRRRRGVPRGALGAFRRGAVRARQPRRRAGSAGCSGARWCRRRSRSTRPSYAALLRDRRRRGRGRRSRRSSGMSDRQGAVRRVRRCRRRSPGRCRAIQREEASDAEARRCWPRFAGVLLAACGETRRSGSSPARPAARSPARSSPTSRWPGRSSAACDRRAWRADRATGPAGGSSRPARPTSNDNGGRDDGRRRRRCAALLALGAARGLRRGPENTLAADPVADSQGSVDTLTGIGEADDPLAGGAGDVERRRRLPAGCDGRRRRGRRCSTRS